MTTQRMFRRHAGLVDQMANTLGLDLEEEAMRGNLSTTEIENAVLRCTGCAQPGACEHWLAVQEGPAQDTPAYCRNVDLFQELRRP
jgi:hypothetical protein